MMQGNLDTYLVTNSDLPRKQAGWQPIQITLDVSRLSSGALAVGNKRGIDTEFFTRGGKLFKDKYAECVRGGKGENSVPN
jgi:hypothetical protein